LARARSYRRRLYYGLAGMGHIPQKSKNATEWTTMISDLGVCAVFLARFS
jgi:hypothetical protein